MAKKKSAGLSSMVQADRDWQIESDMRTLMEAEKIKADPKRLKAAQDLAKEKMMEVAKVASSNADD